MGAEDPCGVRTEVTEGRGSYVAIPCLDKVCLVGRKKVLLFSPSSVGLEGTSHHMTQPLVRSTEKLCDINLRYASVG